MLWLAFVLILIAAGVLLAALARPSRADLARENLFAAVRGTSLAPAAVQPDAQPTASRFKAADQREIAQLMAQAGWAGGLAAWRYRLVSTFGPPAAGFAVWSIAVTQTAFSQALSLAGVAAIVAFLAPRYVLRGVAARRMQAMRREVPQFALLLRMLLDTGMTLEHALHIIVTQADRVVPVIACELETAVRRIQAGQEMAESLQPFRSVFQQGELYDIFVMLRQAAEQGGNVRDSIDSYVDDMEKRMLSNLREFVGKLSGKMSLVMMLLLFPALMIVVGGPAMLAMIRGLAAM